MTIRRLDAMRRAALRSCRSRRGFTIIELIIGLTLGLIVLTSVYKLLMSQSRLYGVQREVADTRQSLRAAAVLLSYELEAVAATAGDFYAIGPSSLSMRSVQGTGVVCAIEGLGAGRRYGLQLASGYFFGDVAGVDSAMVYDMQSLPFGQWNFLKVREAWNGTDAWASGTGGQTPVCFWGDSSVNVPRPQATLHFIAPAPVLDVILVGHPVRTFKPTEFALFQQAGRWWLGRKVLEPGNVNFEILTGPLLPPSDSGLVFTYYDVTGAVTADPSAVAQVEIVLRAESFGSASGAGYKRLRDSLTTRVFLRGNPAP